MQNTIRDECSRARGAQISAIGETLADKAGPPKYRMWFKHPTTLTFADGLLKVGASNLFIASWIKDHLLHEISLPVRAVTERFLRKLGTARFDL
jgi:chromosomal replication initiation ATPase DnaA